MGQSSQQIPVIAERDPPTHHCTDEQTSSPPAPRCFAQLDAPLLPPSSLLEFLGSVYKAPQQTLGLQSYRQLFPRTWKPTDKQQASFRKTTSSEQATAGCRTSFQPREIQRLTNSRVRARSPMQREWPY